MTLDKRQDRENYVREMLDSFVPDLLSARKHEGFVRRLFASDKGKWLSVKVLCGGSENTEQFFRSLSDQVDTELLVVWLDHPNAEGEYAYVHFYLEDFFWSSSGIYNLRCVNQVDAGN